MVDPNLMMVESLSMICPLLEDIIPNSMELARLGFYQKSKPSIGMGFRIDEGIWEVVGASYEGCEEEIIALLQKIKA